MRFSIEERRSLLARRITAFLIDHTAITILSMIYVLIFMEQINNAYGRDLILYLIPFFFIAFLSYLLKDSVKGKSIGKRIMGLQVRSSKNIDKVPSQWRVVLRNITFPLWMVEFLVMIFNKNSRKLGDVIFGTTVVVEKKNNETEQEG